LLILVNNAGQGLLSPVETVDLDEYRDIMELNVFAVLSAKQAVMPIMRKQGGGTILNVSSMVSKNTFPMLAAYASTKYALNALSLTAREELAKDNIIVSVFHPKMTATDFGHNARGNTTHAPAALACRLATRKHRCRKAPKGQSATRPPRPMPQWPQSMRRSGQPLKSGSHGMMRIPFKPKQQTHEETPVAGAPRTA
jgi:short-subunit dehydrogenase